MNLRDFHYLDALEKHRHFGKAADTCFVSQPTLSAQIKKYERYLGVTLFERNGKSVMPTDVGMKIIGCARRILREEINIKRIADNSHDPFKGECKIGAFPTLAPYFFPALVPKLKQTFPQLKLLLIEEKTHLLLEQLQAGDIDLAFLALPIKADNLETIPLFKDEFLLAVSKKHRFAKRKKIKQTDLVDEKLLLLEEGHCLRDQALSFCSIHEWQMEVNYRASSLETLRQMVVADSGSTLIPKIAIQSDKTDICYIPFSKPSPSRHIALLIRKTSTKKQLAVAIAKLLNSNTPT